MYMRQALRYYSRSLTNSQDLLRKKLANPFLSHYFIPFHPCPRKGGGGGGGGTISFQSAADGVQPSRLLTVHFQARARFFNHIHASEPEH